MLKDVLWLLFWAPISNISRHLNKFSVLIASHIEMIHQSLVSSNKWSELTSEKNLFARSRQIMKTTQHFGSKSMSGTDNVEFWNQGWRNVQGDTYCGNVGAPSIKIALKIAAMYGLKMGSGDIDVTYLITRTKTSIAIHTPEEWYCPSGQYGLR